MNVNHSHPEPYEGRGSSSSVLEFKRDPELRSNTYECRVVICPEAEGGFSVHALRLPGVVSQGETLEEALANIKDAFRAAIAVYSDIGAAVPWEDADIDRTESAFERWILVDA